ncbi:MAG TPA: hypothetical protein VMU34_18295 [Mycobacterium sp.]|nr:hypothetical protein [Mycobacterium sp.]
MITTAESNARRGSVGRAVLGVLLHICDDDGKEVAAGEVGTVYFEQRHRAVRIPQRPAENGSFTAFCAR